MDTEEFRALGKTSSLASSNLQCGHPHTQAWAAVGCPNHAQEGVDRPYWEPKPAAPTRIVETLPKGSDARADWRTSGVGHLMCISLRYILL